MSALAPTLSAIGQMSGNRMNGWDNNGTSWWGIVMMSIFGVAVIVAIIWGAIAFSRSARPQAPAAPSGPTPVDILNQRYARGELDTAEYEERKRQLA